MTCGWTGVCRPVFRKVPSSNYRKFWRKTTHFLLFFANFWITHPRLWKICRKRNPCLENLGSKNPPIWASHTRTLNMLCTPPGLSAVAAPRGDWGGLVPSSTKSRQKLSMKNGIKLVGYTLRVKNYVKIPPISFRFFRACAATGFQCLFPNKSITLMMA